MMGHREKLIDGEEQDMLTKRRRVLRSHRGRARAAKRKFHKRVRRRARIRVRQAAVDLE